MNPERFLGHDPSPGDLLSIDDVAGALRDCVIALAEGRQRVALAAGPDTLWQGPHAVAITDTLAAFTGRLRLLEEAVADFALAWQEWRVGVAARQDRTAELVEAMSQLGGREGADGQRDAVLSRAAAVGQEHTAAAGGTGVAAENLMAALATDKAGTDLASDLRQGIGALRAAVDEWVIAAEQELHRAAASVESVAALTTAVPQLIGVGTDPTTVDSPAVREMAASAPGAHRLRDALEHPPAPRAAADLPEASFSALAAPNRSRLGDRLRGLGDPASGSTDDPTDASDEDDSP